MRILLMHNRYVWPGGEDRSVEEQVQALCGRGHEVVLHYADNRETVTRGRVRTALGMWRGAWSHRSYLAAREAVRRHCPDLVHVHNFWFELSPSVLAAAADEGVPVVLTLHNFRLLCPAGVFLDGAGRACRRCVGRLPWPGILGRCYHRSFAASALVAWMITRNRLLRTWHRHVRLALVPSEFCRRQFREGLELETVVCPPGVPAEEPTDAAAARRREEDGAPVLLFAGRLSREKGLFTLLDAWPGIERRTGARLRLAGEGPLRAELEARARGMRVEFLGRLAPAEVAAQMAASAALVLPSQCYETFGRVVVEAYARARPVLVSNLGGPAELVEDGKTGFLFEPGDAADLADKACALLADPARRQRMGAAGRERYLRGFTPEAGCDRLLAAYRRALAET